MGMIERQLRITDARGMFGMIKITVDTGETFDIDVYSPDGENQLVELLVAVGIQHIQNAYELIGKSFGRRALPFARFKAITKTERQQDSAAAQIVQSKRLSEELNATVSTDHELDMDIFALEESAATDYDKAIVRILRQLYERTKL